MKLDRKMIREASELLSTFTEEVRSLLLPMISFVS